MKIPEVRALLVLLLLLQIGVDVWLGLHWSGFFEEWTVHTAEGYVVRSERRSGRVQYLNPNTHGWQEVGAPGNPEYVRFQMSARRGE